MDWTTTGAPPPTGTPPTFICLLVTGRSRTAASVISLPIIRSRLILFRYERGSGEEFTKVRVGCEHEEHHPQPPPEGGHPAHGLLAHGPAHNLLRRYKKQVPPVERQDRQEVEERQVEADDRQQRQEKALRDRRARHGGDPDRTAHVLDERLLPRHQLPDELPERGRDLDAPPHSLPEGLDGPVSVLHDNRPDPHERPVGILGVRYELPRDFALLSVPAHDELHPVPRLFLAHALDEALPVCGPLAVDGDDPVALLYVRLVRQGVRHDVGDLVRGPRHAAHVDAREDHDRSQNVGHRPREDDPRPPPRRL